LALTFPENPNSIDSPLAWNPLSTGIGKLPPGSLRGWWDASKLNANDVYWGYPSMTDLSSPVPCWGHWLYRGNGAQNQNILTLDSSFLNGAAQPGLLLKIEGEATIYQVVSVLNANTLIVSPHFTSSFTNQPILVAQLLNGSGKVKRNFQHNTIMQHYRRPCHGTRPCSAMLYGCGWMPTAATTCLRIPRATT
jgi:hypothetical protein